MFNIRNSILALAAIASLGAAALVSTTSSADARPGFSRGGTSFGGGFNRGGGFRHAGFHRPHFGHRPHWYPRRHVRWDRPWVYGVGGVAMAAPAYAAVAPRPAAPAPCTCLSKEHTQDNLVVFKDRCTNEAAASPIGGQPQQSQLAPQPGEGEPVPQK